jgi:serine protease Do
LKVLYQGSQELDLCLLKIQSSNSFSPIAFAKHHPTLGAEVSTIGNPRGIGLSISKGYISRLGEDGDLQLNIQLNPGNSGGPVVNSQGELVGIISFLIEEIQAMSFAIGLPQIEAFIEAAKGGH